MENSSEEVGVILYFEKRVAYDAPRREVVVVVSRRT